MTTTRVTISGMTCEHCVASVREELSELSGVQDVDVVLSTGAVTITSATPLEPSDLESAVTEAGYALAYGRPPARTVDGVVAPAVAVVPVTSNAP